MQIMGHRGAAGLVAENTLPSIQKALDIGVDWVEFDVHRTRDGKLVVIHDSFTRRIAHEWMRVKNQDLLTLQQLETKSGHRIPTFTEVVQLIGDRAKINVEVKSKGCADEIADTIKKLTKADYLYDHFLVSSFSPKLLAEVREKNKNIKLSLLHRLLPFGFTSVHKDLHLSAAGFSQFHITPQVLQMAKRRGLMTYVYTVNSQRNASRFASWGVDALITNRPDRMVELFHDKSSLAN
jgi:glycerophosphoryl diester phosphodiesterase